MIAPVEVVVVLNTDQTSAFTAFVENVNDWWPVESFSIAKGVVSIEPVLGGKITETSADGTDHVAAPQRRPLKFLSGLHRRMTGAQASP